MPITLPPLNRRRFLEGTTILGAGLLAGRNVIADDNIDIDPNRFAVLSDTHIGSPDAQRWPTTASLRKVVEEVLELRPRPAAVFVNGDCAFGSGDFGVGTPEDYVLFVDLVRPLREAGLPVHVSIGNHDDRDILWDAIPAEDGQKEAVDDRHITVLEGERANWFVLDSKRVINASPGALGEAQLEWLAGALDQHDDKPAIVMMHHNPNTVRRNVGLTDTRNLFEVIVPRKHVKALFHGHIHQWHTAENEGIHRVSLPTTAYVFQDEEPLAWLDMHLLDDGLRIDVHCLDRDHEAHGREVELSWRT